MFCLHVLNSQVIRDMLCTSMFHLDQWTMYCRTSPGEPWKTRVFLREYSKRGVFCGESWKGGSEKESWNMTQLWYKLVLHELVLILFSSHHTRCFQGLLFFPWTEHYCIICLHGNSALWKPSGIANAKQFWEAVRQVFVHAKPSLHWMNSILWEDFF